MIIKGIHLVGFNIVYKGSILFMPYCLALGCQTTPPLFTLSVKKMAAIPFAIFFSGKRTLLFLPGISGNLILMPLAGNLYIFEPKPVARRVLLTNLLNPIIIWNYYILCSWGWRRSMQLAKARPRVDCGSDHELLIVKFRLKLKKVEKTTRPFSCDLNQINPL